MLADIVRNVQDVRALVAGWRKAGRTVALVPTMGNLHAGHISLARLARGEADRVLMTIFVNRTQFGAGEDFGAYPRTLEQDHQQATESGVVDALFAPDESEIYPFGTEDAVRVVMPALARELCGASRHGHFDGVGSVVSRLLNIATPDVMVLGRKDFQQLKLIERMVADLRFPVRIVAGAIRREADGLAMSSRNRYLSPEERASAPVLHASLMQAAEAIARGEDHLEACARAVLTLRSAGFEPDYVEARRGSDLLRPQTGDRGVDLVVLAAAWLGRARLIDNVTVAEALSRNSGLSLANAG